MRRPRAGAPLGVALALSLCLHAALIVAPEVRWSVPRPWPQPRSLRVVLAEPRPVRPPAPVPTAPVREDAGKASPSPHTVSPSPSRRETPAAFFPDEGAESAAPPLAIAAEPDVGVVAAQAEGERYPARGRILYSVSRGSQGFVLGEGVLSWEIEPPAANDPSLLRRYRIRLQARTTGAASFALFFRTASLAPLRFAMESEGVFGDASGFRPEAYRTWKNDVPGHAATFLWAERALRLDAEPPVFLQEGSQDLLSLMLQFAFVPFSGSLAANMKQETEVWLVTGRKYERLGFDVIDSLLLTQAEAAPPSPAEQEGLPVFPPQASDGALARLSGAFEVLHVRSGTNNPVELWLARDYLMLPLRLRIHFSDDDEVYELRARELTLDVPEASDVGAFTPKD